MLELLTLLWIASLVLFVISGVIWLVAKFRKKVDRKSKANKWMIRFFVSSVSFFALIYHTYLVENYDYANAIGFINFFVLLLIASLVGYLIMFFFFKRNRFKRTLGKSVIILFIVIVFMNGISNYSYHDTVANSANELNEEETAIHDSIQTDETIPIDDDQVDSTPVVEAESMEPKPEVIEVQMDTTVERNEKKEFRITGTTNLPDGFLLDVTLDADHYYEKKYEIVVQEGTFSSEWFDAPLVDEQGNLVVEDYYLSDEGNEMVIGEKGEYITGQWVVEDDQERKSIVYTKEIAFEARPDSPYAKGSNKNEKTTPNPWNKSVYDTYATDWAQMTSDQKHNLAAIVIEEVRPEMTKTISIQPDELVVILDNYYIVDEENDMNVKEYAKNMIALDNMFRQ